MLVVIQRGHVPRTTGATGAPGEQQFAIEASERCRARVSALGHTVRLINADEPNQRYAGDMFFALHYDSSRNPGVRGASVGYQTAEGRRMAQYWKDHYARNGWTGGFRGDNYTEALAEYYGVRRAVAQGNKRAVILEAGFHSNAPDPDPELEDSQLLRSPTGPDRVAIAVAATVVDMIGGTCPPDTGPDGYPGQAELGDEGNHVRVWQDTLNRKYLGAAHAIAVDGEFGLATHHAVISFQRARGLEADGIAGPATWRALTVPMAASR